MKTYRAGVTVQTQTEEHSFLGLFSWTTTTYKLSTANSNFDWGQNDYTSGLFDCINSKEINFNVSFVPGDTKTSFFAPAIYTLYNAGGGITNSYEGGADIRISKDGNRVNDPIGVVLMHELVGHGHPAGGKDARDVNKHYGYPGGGIEHGGYHKVINWKKTGLYNPPIKDK